MPIENGEVGGTSDALVAVVVVVVKSATLVGVDAALVEVECEVARGLPTYTVVGLPATSVREGTTRVRSALTTIGHDLPLKRVTVNLAPADLRKPGCALDLPIALAVLLADGADGGDRFDDLLVLGELGLDGGVRPVHGALASAMLARARGLRGIVVPEQNAAEAAVVDGISVFAVGHLSEVLDALAGTEPLRPPGAARQRRASRPPPDMSEVRGQDFARAAIEVAVAGGHNLLLSGPPGTGKTMLARRIPGICPPMTRDEALETTKIYSSTGAGREVSQGLVTERPFRAPHHSISASALIGGGTAPRAGEISLAHNGVLFLDELPEFSSAAIEGLREPLEDRSITIGRVHGTLRLPASFLLVAAANPCPCGWAGSGVRECTCPPGALERYRRRLSGPLLDRIDLQIYVRPVAVDELRSIAPGESTAAIRARVVEARDRQRARLAPWGLHCNAEMPAAVLRATCPLDDVGERTLTELVARRPSFTARSVDRVIRVARTIADLLGQDAIDAACLLEATAYRDADPCLDALPRVA